MLYYALSYCFSIVSFANYNNISKITKLQKKAIHITHSKKYDDHTALKKKNFKILP